MTHAMSTTSKPCSSELVTVCYPNLAESKLNLILRKISKLELPGAEHRESYMEHKWRMNHKPSTLRRSFYAVRSFLTFYVSSGKKHLQEIANDDQEAFIEHEQDRVSKSQRSGHGLNTFGRSCSF